MCNLWSVLILPLPLLALDPHVWVINVDPSFVHGDYLTEYSWAVALESQPELTDINSALDLARIEDTRHKFGTSLHQLQVLLDDPVDSTEGYACPLHNTADVTPSVTRNAVLHLPDVGSASA